MYTCTYSRPQLLGARRRRLDAVALLARPQGLGAPPDNTIYQYNTI